MPRLYNEAMMRKRKEQLAKPVDARKPIERLFEGGFFLCACMSVLAIALISVFIFVRGVPAITQIGLFNFLFGTTWKPSGDIFGILPMIVNSLLSGLLAVLIGSVIGILTACFMTDIAGKRMQKIMRPAIDLLAGIPSVVYGFFGLMVIVPTISSLFGGFGLSMLAVIIILSMMILPTVVSITVDAIRAVPKEYREGSLALGATKMQTLFHVVLPAAKKTILAGVVLGMGRAIGETMAVLLVSGNRAFLPTSILDPIRTLTGNVALEMGYATGLHLDALYGTGVVLFVFIMALNLFLRALSHERGKAQQ